MKKMAALLAGAALMLTTASAMALPMNDNRPFTPNGPSGTEDSLQTILNENFNGSINAVTGQSKYGVWETTDGSPAAYAVAFMKGDAGNFGIYSYATGAEVTLMTNPAVAKTKTFNINAAGHLVNGDGEVMTGGANFGFTFGFFWRDTDVPGISYTEDSKNAAGTGWGADRDIRALTFLVPDQTTLTGTLASYFAPSGQVAEGDDDWVMTFEDRGRNIGGDGDFNDAVFYVKDIDPVPEPGTMLLLGAGFLGLAIYGKRRKNA